MANSKSMKRYEDYLFTELNAVPLSLVQSTSDLKPLDVLVKQPSKEKKDGFVLARVGSLFEESLVITGHPLQQALELGGDRVDAGEQQLALSDAPAQQLALSDAQAQLPLVVPQMQQQANSEVVAPKFQERPVKNLLEFKDGDNGFFDSLISLLKFEFRNQKSLIVQASGINCVSTDNGSLMDLFTGPQPQRSVNVEHILSRDSSLSRNEKGELELWVVTHLFVCDTLTFAAKSEKGGLSELQLPVDQIVAGAVTGVPAISIPGLKCTVGGGKRRTQFELTSAGHGNSPTHRVPLAFRAIRLVYGRDGTLKDRHLNVAPALPRKRAGKGVSSVDEHLRELIDLEIVDKPPEARKDGGAEVAEK